MKKGHYFVLITLFLVTCQSNKECKQDQKLWYRQPANVWEEALPLGNGTTGAMVWGGVQSEHYSLNDHTLWSGEPNPGNIIEGAEILTKIRKAVDTGNYEKASHYWRSLQGPYSARYLPLGDLILEFDFDDCLITDYKRELNLNNAISTIEFQKDGITYKRESFISYPDQVMVIRLSADKKQKISFDALLSSKLKHEVKSITSNHLRLTGKAPKHVAHRNYEPQQVVYDKPEGKGMNFEIDLKFKTNGGSYILSEDKIGVRNANEVIILLSESTSYNGFEKSPSKEGKNPSIISTKNMDQAFSLSYKELLRNHVNDYSELFERVEFNLGTQRNKIETKERLLEFKNEADDLDLITLCFQYGRYLLISSSRGGFIPINLQGIWNPHIQPPWGSNYTMNINTEMNYWPAEVTNLAECHVPLLNFTECLSINGYETAKLNYNIQDGWVAHHNSDVWAKTSPTGGGTWDSGSAPRWSCWPMAGAWLSLHLWEHYRYSGDITFLEEKAWPLMKGAAEFMLSWMVKDKNGFWVTNPSTSPENTVKVDGQRMEISKASTMDMSIIRELFASCIDAAGILNFDDKFTTRLKETFPDIYPFQIGQYGQLQEWFKDWDDPNEQHRHISHLFSLYPGEQITLNSTPELARAAKQTLIQRGDYTSGWSKAWKVNCWARLQDGNHALKILCNMLNYADPNKEGHKTGGIYPNLFNAHPPFQIDGNMGFTAGIAEMLVQSHEGYIHLLPALPDKWKDGVIKGIKARGGFVIDIEWAGGKLKEASIYSLRGGICKIMVKEKMVGENFLLNNPNEGYSNPLLKKAPIVQFINNSKVDLVNCHAPQGYLYEWETSSAKKYKIKAQDSNKK